MTRSPSGRSLLAVIVAMVLLVSACSSGDGEQTESGAASDTETSDTETSDTETSDATSDETADGAGDDDPASTTTSVARQTLPTVADSTSDDAAEPDSDGADGDNADDGDGETGQAPNDSRDDLPTTAAELAAAINEAELALRAPGIDEASAAPWGRRQQALYRVLAFNPEWAPEVLAGADPEVSEAVSLNWQARQELISLVKSHSLTSTLPAWRIEPPRPADELLGYYREAEEASGVPWEILASINLVETRMGRIQGISSAGALGPMQFLPTTWAECCEGDPTNPRDAINGAGKYLVQRGAETDLDRAIFGYNNSDYYVTAITSYAAVMEDDPNAYYGYHAWQVYYLSTEGLIVIPEGYEQPEPIAATEWLGANPDTLFPDNSP